MRLSKRLENFSEYVFSQLNKRIANIEKETGRKVLNLAPGSPDFPPSKIYIEKLKQIIDESGIHLYPGYGAIDEFKNALKSWYKTRFQTDIFDDELYPTLGGKDAISHLPMTLIDEGDEVLTPDPGYPAFSGSVLIIGGKPVFYQLTEKNNFKIEINELEKLAGKTTKFIWVNFPGNPTGQTVSLSELEPIVDFCLGRKIWLVYDNAYSEITFDGYRSPSVLQIKKAKEIAIEIGSFSKSFSFAGFRIGWVAGNKNLISAFAKVKSQMDSGLSLVWQKLAAFALNNFDENWHNQMIKTYQNRRDIISFYLKKLGLTFDYPKASLYLWAKIPDKYKNSQDFSFEILERYKVLLTPGSAFGSGGERYVRASICSNIDKISEYFNYGAPH